MMPGFSAVPNSSVFKNRLQEYAQKMGLPAPLYETIIEGPSHKPSFRSTVILNDVRYDSLPGSCKRKAAEQSAAEVALLELEKFGEISECISEPVHETGLCKALLQQYAQKLNYAIPCMNAKGWMRHQGERHLSFHVLLRSEESVTLVTLQEPRNKQRLKLLEPLSLLYSQYPHQFSADGSMQKESDGDRDSAPQCSTFISREFEDESKWGG